LTSREEKFLEALKDKRVPVLVLDNKWYKLFKRTGTTSEIEKLEKELDELLKKQGKLNNEIKDLKKIKNNLMNEIVSNMDGLEGALAKDTDKKLKDNKKLINEVNQKMEEDEDALLEIPREIDSVNKRLMVETMDLCYEKLQNNTEEIEEIANWIHEVRVQLKKNLIKKQEKEINNAELYSYMHDIFGQDVMELFDMKYEPTLPSVKKSEKNLLSEDGAKKE